MGAFICQISEQDWVLSRQIGLYGNRDKKPGSSEDLREQERLSVIRDLISVEPGDYAFFHVICRGGESRIHGIYRAKSSAFFDQTPIWENNYELFPYRFSFEPHASYTKFTGRDCFVWVSELYQKIETREIWSLATLENEINLEGRAVRKISMEDAWEIVKLLVRHPKFLEASRIEYDPYKNDSPIPLEDRITYIGRLENSIKAFLMSGLKQNPAYINDLFGEVTDYMNETFVAQTTRKQFDFLVISSVNEHRKAYYIIEAKARTYSRDNLTQLLNYIDLFASRAPFDRSRDSVIGSALASGFSRPIRDLVARLRRFGIYENLELLQYVATEDGRNATIERVNLPEVLIDQQLIEGVDNSFKQDMALYTLPAFTFIDSQSDTLSIKTVLFRDNGSSVSLKDYVIFEEDVLTSERLCAIFGDFNHHIREAKGNDFSICNLVLRFRKIEVSAAEIIREYNDLLRRPMILQEPVY